ncbi:uncharacterized protein LOC127856414 isoform X1 [Dreissena polymorpha]|nr:uncharacterized protein LOC127856414 isoform X1 [Dreissena polymorpha]
MGEVFSMNSFLSSLSRPFNRSTSVHSQKDAPLDETHRGSEHEADGFLLVGQTASERTTVYGNMFNSSGMDAPPSYEQMQGSGFHRFSGQTGHSLAFQSPTLDVSQWRKSNPGASMHADENSQPLADQSDSLSTRHHVGALTGVPFQMCKQLSSLQTHRHICSSDIWHLSDFDLSRYEYDFNIEQSYLDEHPNSIEQDSMQWSRYLHQ